MARQVHGGLLDRRISIERRATTRGRFNEPVGEWAEIGSVWAERRDVSDAELLVRASDGFDAGKRGAYLASRFTVRESSFTRGIQTTDRISTDGKLWSIRGIKETRDGRGRFLEITAACDLDTEDDI